MQIMTINEFANQCGYFYNAELDPEATCAPNNGYNCRHPKQEEKHNGVGCCFQWSCPLAIPADEEEKEKYGYEYEENEFVLMDEAEVEEVAERKNDQKAGSSESPCRKWSGRRKGNSPQDV